MAITISYPDAKELSVYGMRFNAILRAPGAGTANGIVVRVLVDTGARLTLIDPACRPLGKLYEHQKPVLLQGLNGAATPTKMHDVEFSIGNLKPFVTTAAFVNLHSGTGLFDVLLGRDALESLTFRYVGRDTKGPAHPVILEVDVV